MGVSGIRSKRMIKAFVVLLRNTTWKCGVVERRVVTYLRGKRQNGEFTQSSVNDMFEHFEVDENEHQRFFEAMDRLEKRGIIKVIFHPFSLTQDSGMFV
ncbi:MAG: hypothetical protein CW716_05755 [Candidatus Bathyarchaeum sp.]|nr:MAG: hypothetical protein CW716_05755 [Candidatus Bathyarchaeum sp.]